MSNDFLSNLVQSLHEAELRHQTIYGMKPSPIVAINWAASKLMFGDESITSLEVFGYPIQVLDDGGAEPSASIVYIDANIYFNGIPIVYSESFDDIYLDGEP